MPGVIKNLDGWDDCVKDKAVKVPWTLIEVQCVANMLLGYPPDDELIAKDLITKLRAWFEAVR